MNGPGRPTSAAIAKRRRRLVQYLVGAAAASEEAVLQIARKLVVGPRAIRSDLEAIRLELEEEEPRPRETGPDESTLAEAVRSARTFRKLGALVTRLAAAVADDALEKDKAEILERLVARRARVLKEERLERNTEKLHALEILTPGEVELLERHRRERAGPPLEPGEAVRPPSSPES